MNIDELTLGQLKEISKLTGCASPGKGHSFTIGQKIFLRAVTYHYTGRVVAVTDTDVVLDDAAWIASSGRFADALESGELSEVEPYPGRCVVSRGAIVDWCEWPHELPRAQK